MIINYLSIVFSAIFGTLLHFTYEWSNKNKLVGLFSATNESTFEHIKMGINGRLLVLPVEVHLLGHYPNYYLSVLIEILLIPIFIILFFYGYQLIFKKANMIYDILIFYLSIILSYFIGFKILYNLNTTIFSIHAYTLISIILLIEICLTVRPFNNFLFKKPN